jgi:hypothetical protein
VDVAAAQEAVKAVRRDFEVLLSRQQLARLNEIHKIREIDNDDNYRELLHNLSCLEYQNDDIWYDVHPVVEPLLNGAP